MAEIGFIATFGEERRQVQLTGPHGEQGDYFLTLDRRFCGAMRKTAGAECPGSRASSGGIGGAKPCAPP